MAYVQNRQVNVGELLTGTFHELTGIKRELAIYFGAFLVVGIITDVLGFAQGPLNFLAFLAYFAAQYWLYRAALKQAGIVYDDRFKVFSMLFMALLLTVPLYIAFAFIVVPGVLLASKWIMAPAFLVAEEMNLFEALGGSWRASENNLGAIAGAFTVICVIWLGLFVVLGGILSVLSGAAFGSPGGANGLSWVVIHILPVLLLGLSVSAYRALSNTEDSLVAVFE